MTTVLWVADARQTAFRRGASFGVLEMKRRISFLSVAMTWVGVGLGTALAQDASSLTHGLIGHWPLVMDANPTIFSTAESVT
jgi:hypothetical protein